MSPNRLARNDVSPRERDEHAREKDAGSTNSSAIGATEDVLSRRSVGSGGRDLVLRQPPSWNILFVDDDRDFLDAQAAFFGGKGHTVHTLGSSQEALDYLQSSTPDIIFLDLMMERYDSGFRLAHQIRKNQRLAATPIVMLSGVGRETGQRFDQEGKSLLSWSQLDRFVDKPATGKQLLNLAEELLGSGDACDEATGRGAGDPDADGPDGGGHGAGATKDGAS